MVIKVKESMIPDIMPGIDGSVLIFIDCISRVIEILAVIMIFGGVILGIFRYFIKWNKSDSCTDYFKEFRQYLGQWLLLGLEILVAADVIRTVALDQTLESVISLGLLVIIRTFLSWALVVEMEGRWPWQQITDDQKRV